MDFIKKAISFGLGAMILTEEKIRETVDELVKKGELSKEDSKTMVKEMLDRVKENKKFVENKVAEEFERFMKKTHMATHGDIHRLEKKIEELEKLLREKASK